jgi:hypothetical protein
MKHLQYGVLGFCFLAVACAGGGPNAPTSPSIAAGAGNAATAATGGSELPFRGTLDATETEDGTLHHLVGSGNATHLGRFTLEANFTVDSATATGSGTATWTAANGDQLFTTETGHAVVTFPTAAISETHTITGGTGRFADASGSISIERSINLPTLVSSGSITGTINLGH